MNGLLTRKQEQISYRATAIERIVQGVPYVDAVLAELDHYGYSKVHVVTGRSLSRTPLFASLVSGLGNRLAGVSAGIPAHTPRPDVLQAAEEVRLSGADVLVALGGGSVIDAVKMIQLCVWNEIRSYNDFDRFSAAARADPSTRRRPSRTSSGRLRYRRRFRRPNLTGMPAAPTHSVPQNTATRTRISCRER